MSIEIQELTHQFPGKPSKTALLNLQASIPSGQFVALVGTSGCGKSTLLRLIANLLTPTAGIIELDGISPVEMKKSRQTAWMAQSPALLPWLTARENIELAQRFTNPYQSRRTSTSDALERVGLGTLNGEYPAALSGGMQQRVALARLLVQNATIWLMDEPFAALDEITREILSSELLDIWTPTRPTVLWVTHNIFEAIRLADRVLVFTPGPGTIAADINIQLPRPRQDMDPEFQRYLVKTREVLKQAAQWNEQRA